MLDMADALLTYSTPYRLRDKVSIDSLQDSTLLVVFSYLDPQSLCKCAQVSI